MFKEFIKIQFIALLILVLNAVASQNIKLIPKEESPTKKSAITKSIKKKSKKKEVQFPTITSTSPRGMILKALENSLN